MGLLSDVLGSVTGGLLGTDASSDAAEASAKGQLAGVAENRRQFDTVLNLQAPAINTGNAARSLLASILGLELPASSYTYGGVPGAGSGAVPGAPPGFMGSFAPMRIGGRADNVRRTPWKQPVPGQTGGLAGGLTFNTPASSPMSAADITARLEAFPGYRFAVDQATKSAQALGSATGSLGGNVLTQLGDRVGGGIALPTFWNYINSLSGLSGGGANASTTASQGALSTGANVAQGLAGAGDARASGILGRNQNIGNAIGTVGSILGGMGGGGGGGNAAPWANPVGNGGLNYLFPP